MNRLLRILRSGMLLILGLNLVLYFMQPQLAFYPVQSLEATPAVINLPYQEVSLNTRDGERLHGWYLPHEGAEYTLLFLHGNGGNISHRLLSLQLFHELGLNVLIFDYRGYGQSTGEPDEKGLYADAQSAWLYLTGQRGIAPEHILIFGRSLGGAVAVNLAAREQAAALILESTFSSAGDMAGVFFPLLSPLLYVRYEFPSEQLIEQVNIPLLMMHSTEDEIIPYELGKRLYQAAGEPKRWHRLGGDHNSGFLKDAEAYKEVWREFIRGLKTTNPPKGGSV